MNKIQFDSNGIYASNDYLKSIALQVLEQEKQERECRRATRYDNWGYWNISDRH